MICLLLLLLLLLLFFVLVKASKVFLSLSLALQNRREDRKVKTAVKFPALFRRAERLYCQWSRVCFRACVLFRVGVGRAMQLCSRGSLIY